MEGTLMRLPKGADPVSFTADDTFMWQDRELFYFDHPYNTTLLNDRAVEVPIARSFIDGRHGIGIEVGNVLSHYGTVEHRVVDRWENEDGVENVDVFDIHGGYDWIVAISTLEHVRWDEPDDGAPFGAVYAARHLRALLNPSGRMLVTVPFGQNPYLDGAILCGALGAVTAGTMLFHPDGWEEAVGALWRPVRGRRWASAVWVAEFGPLRP
jgi:hypothetical protein